MGEVDQPTWASRMLEGARRRVAGLILPSGLARLEDLEDRNSELALRLQRMTQQRNKLEEDVGLMKERTWAQLLVGDYNPEKISLTEYKKMMDYDAQVRAGYDLIAMGVLMKPWRIRHPDEEVAMSITGGLERLRYPGFRDAMKEMLTAICYGYSVTEIVFDDWKDLWMPRQRNGLKTFDPESVTFFSDSFGNLRKIEQRVTGSSLVELPLGRTLVWSHGKIYGNWYGESILRACYKNWFIKDAMLKFANIGYERFGSPILMGIAPTPGDAALVQEAIEHLYARSQGTIVRKDKDDTTDVKVLESRRRQMPFESYIRYQDEMILRRMLIGQRLFEGGGGTYGPKVPFDIILMRFEDFRLELIESMNHLLQVISELNWDLDVYPKFDFAPMTTMDMEALRKSIFDALDREIIEKDEDWVRPELGFPAKPKKQEFAAILAGRYLVDPHAAWLASGRQTVIVGPKPYKQYEDEEIYIVGDGGIYGTMIEGPPEGPFRGHIREKYRSLHKISEEEWSSWWPNETKFYMWRPKILKRFDSPLKYKPPEDVQDYIKRVAPEDLGEEVES